MKAEKLNYLKNYSGIILLISGIVLGSIVGLLLGDKVEAIKPLGDIFLNLLFTAVIPLVFFAVSSAIANIDRSTKIGRIMGVMGAVFLGTVLISALFTIAAFKLFPVNEGVQALPVTEHTEEATIGSQITSLLTTSEFFQLQSRKSMLALIIFSVLIGFATLRSGKSGDVFKEFLNSGNEVMKQLFIIIMKVAPIGLGAYFAYQAGVFGPQLFGTYAKSMAVYYGAGIIYFALFFTLYAFFAGGETGVKIFWRNNIIPSFTALGTCSSIATIPANLDAAEKMGIPPHIKNTVIPLGASLHKDGSSMSSITKIVVVFAMFGKDFAGVDTIMFALGITVLVSIVEGGIPNGGYIGEILFISAYNFPPEALPAAMIIGTLVDPMATLLNATGDTVSGMLVARFTEGREWIKKLI